MLSAADFLPSYMTEFMNFVMMIFPNLGSGFTSRFSAEWRRDIDQVPDYFGRFAPYFERRCLRFLTPWVSRTVSSAVRSTARSVRNNREPDRCLVAILLKSVK